MMDARMQVNCTVEPSFEVVPKELAHASDRCCGRSKAMRASVSDATVEVIAAP